MNKVFKVLSAAVIAGVVAVSAFCTVSAAGLNSAENRIMDELNTTVSLNGTATKLPAQYVNQAENYFLQDDVDITDAQADQIIAAIKDCKKFLEDAKVSTYGQLSDDQMKELVALANKASGVVEVRLTFDRPSKVVTAYDKNGNVIGKGSTGGNGGNSGTTGGNGGVIKTTGADVQSVAFVAGLGVLLVTGAGVYLISTSKKERTDA